jgi:hypothetical protein
MEETRWPLLRPELEAVVLQHMAAGQPKPEASAATAPAPAAAVSAADNSNGQAPAGRRRRSNTETSLSGSGGGADLTIAPSAGSSSSSSSASAGVTAADSHAALLMRLCASPPPFLDALWAILDDTIKVAQCDVYTYAPPWEDVDPMAVGALCVKFVKCGQSLAQAFLHASIPTMQMVFQLFLFQ